MLYILCRRYCPGEAWTNRILAYAKGLSELGCSIILVFLITDKSRYPLRTKTEGFCIINLWEKDNTCEKKFKILSLIHNLFRFRSLIKEEDDVFIYGGDDYLLSFVLQLKRRGNVITEITENPYIHCDSKLQALKIRHNIKTILRVDHLLVISKHLQDFFINKGYSKEKVSVINMFVDTTRFDGIKKDNKEKYIAYCGAVSYKKDGVDTLIKAFSIFSEAHSNYKLYIIGKGAKPNVIEKLKALSENEGINDSVVFTGFVLPKDMPQLLVNAEMLALSRPNNLQAQHGFPTKLGEYLATGNPVVVTNVGEIPDFIQDKVNGILAESGDVTDFAEKLSWIADHPEESKQIGLQGKKLARLEFSYLSQSMKLKEIIDK